MARVSKVTTTILSESTTITKNTTTALTAVSVNLQEALTAAIYMTYAWAVAPTAGKVLNIYAVYSEDDSLYSDVDVNTMALLGSVTLTADTNTHNVVILLDPTKLSPKFMKLVFHTDEATNDGTCTSLKVSVMRAL